MKNNSNNRLSETARQIFVRGRVQGVGFRPFVYRLAKSLDLAGNVLNSPDGVIIHIEGDLVSVKKFISGLCTEAPFAAMVKQIDDDPVGYEGLRDFVIRKSSNDGETITEICPDIAICPDCLEEMFAAGRRQNYPFINCTNCGPRFTIFKSFPYDRPNTSMDSFVMCRECSMEYHDPLDRRFHAQPVSCPDCGPEYSYHKSGDHITEFSHALNNVANDIASGKVVAIKSLGGYNLVCDATIPGAVSEIRIFKQREKKPFALMFHNIEAIRYITGISDAEAQIISSWQRPIVIVPLRKTHLLPEGITSGLNTVGAFLPYLPLHYLLFEKLKTSVLVMTSGNSSDEPIMTDDEQALSVFAPLSGGILSNNRAITNRVDDSVVRVICKKTSLLRRARGYVPAPVDLNFDVTGILAAGAELSNCFCLGKGRQAIFSQHIGDLKNAETFSFYRENIEKFTSIYRQPIRYIACDLHPDYLSTKFAREAGLPVTETQHHHAHVCSVMAEHGLNEPVIGIAYDGTGLGTDGHIWGSETMITGYTDFERIGHFEYIPLPGGDLAVKEPWRSAVAYLYHMFGENFQNIGIDFLKKFGEERINFVIQAIQKKINSPLCCSAGRLFDAVAALLDICTKSSYHAEAPLLLENYLDPAVLTAYSYSGEQEISFKPMFEELIKDLKDKVSPQEIVTRFHNTIADVVKQQVTYAARRSGINIVVISGGTFQNKYLTEKIVSLLANNFEIRLPLEIPANDGGIALGQMAIAAHRNSYKEKQ